MMYAATAIRSCCFSSEWPLTGSWDVVSKAFIAIPANQSRRDIPFGPFPLESQDGNADPPLFFIVHSTQLWINLCSFFSAAATTAVTDLGMSFEKGFDSFHSVDLTAVPNSLCLCPYTPHNTASVILPWFICSHNSWSGFLVFFQQSLDCVGKYGIKESNSQYRRSKIFGSE